MGSLVRPGSPGRRIWEVADPSLHPDYLPTSGTPLAVEVPLGDARPVSTPYLDIVSNKSPKDFNFLAWRISRAFGCIAMRRRTWYRPSCRWPVIVPSTHETFTRHNRFKQCSRISGRLKIRVPLAAQDSILCETYDQPRLQRLHAPYRPPCSGVRADANAISQGFPPVSQNLILRSENQRRLM